MVKICIQQISVRIVMQASKPWAFLVFLLITSVKQKFHMGIGKNELIILLSIWSKFTARSKLIISIFLSVQQILRCPEMNHMHSFIDSHRNILVPM